MKTVFIVGAGASQEAKLPTGSELMDRIIRALSIEVDFGRPTNGDSKIAEALSIVLKAGHPYSNDMSPFINAAQHICRALRQTNSIDRFIDSQSRNEKIELCGKLAIVRTILQAEDQSPVFVGHRPNGKKKEFNYLEGTWFHEFFKLLTTFKRSELQERLGSIVLIIFNYDRCIEQYLYHALQNYHDGMSADEAANLISKLQIYHPYGTVGCLPWLKPNNLQPDHVTLFGHDPQPQQLVNLTKQIKTFTEVTDESSSDVTAIRSHMKTARRLVFLGFAFHSLNIELLLPKSESMKPGDVSSPCHVYATALNMSESDISHIRNELRYRGSLSEKRIDIRKDLTCNQLIHDYSLTLSLM